MPFARALIARSAVGLAIIAGTFGPGTELARAGGPPFIITSGFAIAGRATDMVVDASGNVYLAGVIGTYRFPGVDSAAITNAGMDLRYVVKVPPLGSTASVVSVVGAPTSTLLAARSDDFGKDEASGLALDAGGNAYLVAYDGTKDYPISGGQYFETTGRKYVFKVTASGQVTKLSSALDPAIKRVGAIAVDANGGIFLTGSASEGLLTTVGAPYPTSSVAAGCMAPYVMKLDATGQTTVYKTYLGYSGTQGQMCGGMWGSVVDPTGFAIAVDSTGNAYVTGQAEPGLLASPGAVDLGTRTGTFFTPISHGTASHAFVTKDQSDRDDDHLHGADRRVAPRPKHKHRPGRRRRAFDCGQDQFPGFSDGGRRSGRLLSLRRARLPHQHARGRIPHQVVRRRWADRFLELPAHGWRAAR